MHVKKKVVKYDTDGVMRKMLITLIEDFQKNHGDPSLYNSLLCIIKQGSVSEIRGALDDLSDGPFKERHQLKTLLKRYRFKNDLFTDSELDEKAEKAFQATQSRLRQLDLSKLDRETELVLKGAAVVCHQILGAYDDEYHRSLCIFGKRASYGVPARLACEAERWQIPLSGSCDQIEWFDAEMRRVETVQNYWLSQLQENPSGSLYHEVDTLNLTLVNKTFKSRRCIVPNTTIGSYMTKGLGDYIQKRLKVNGYDITALQFIHRHLAKRGSVHGFYTTADLSSASDSITDALLARILPPCWMKILRLSRIEKVKLPSGEVEELETFATMGVGYTFPLETLVFLCLLKSIWTLYNPRRSKGVISVYGDDLIYPTSMHDEVVRHFPAIGLCINFDKTYTQGPFRESCGGDYHHGIEVRPFNPEGEGGGISQKRFHAYLFKCINGLKNRWASEELESTLNYLLCQAREVGPLYVVPSDFPDVSGIQSSLPLDPWLKDRGVKTPRSIGHGIFRFSYLGACSDLRKEERHEPYLWLSLRGGLDSAERYTSRACEYIQPLPKHLLNLRQLAKEFEFAREHGPLEWVVVDSKTVRSCVTGRRIPKMESWVTIPTSTYYKRKASTSRFER